jgi:hypothetical protein
MKQILFSIIVICLAATTAYSQAIGDQFFNDTDQFLKTHVKDGRVNYAALQNNTSLNSLIDQIKNADVSGLDDQTLKAFYINAYNLHVINKVTNVYPIKSILKNPGFFKSDEVQVANSQMTLNSLEKDKLLNAYNDPRFHFVLVCGALGCPPITNFAYIPAKLDEQLDTQTRAALNDPNFIQVGDGNVGLSQIFKWYMAEFGKSQPAVISYINQYRETAIDTGSKVDYYNYDWSLNDASQTSTATLDSGNSKSSNEYRYVVSSTIAKGSAELKLFNNLYSQQTGETELTDRSSFYTATFTGLYGLTDRINVGVHGRYRKTRNNPLPSSPFSAFGSGGEGSDRSGLTGLGPMVRIAPIKQWSNFSIQSSFIFAIGDDLQGSSGTQPFIEWDGHIWWTQIFNDFSIGDKFSLFTELDLFIEDIGNEDEGRTNRVSTPATLIFSYIPTPKITLYTLASYSPLWSPKIITPTEETEIDYFRQFGLGGKYQFTPKFEIELLYTDFNNRFLNSVDGQAETINLGIRVNI